MRCSKCGRTFDADAKFCAVDATPLVPSADDDPMIGKVISQRYEITGKLGEGGMGVVYQAQQLNIERPVAVKLLATGWGKREEAKQRFLREARVVSRLASPHTITLHDFGELEDGQLYMVMELLWGRTLEDRLNEEERLSWDDAVRILDQVAMSLDEAHARGVVHRDLKPGNIFLAETHAEPEFVKVLDFGMASLDEPDVARLTGAGQVVGTPEYMSPERVNGQLDDQRGDFYALGVILFEMLTGELPFEAKAPFQMMVAHVQQGPRDLREVCPDADVPPHGLELLRRCLAKDPQDRPASSAEFRAALAGTPFDPVAAARPTQPLARQSGTTSPMGSAPTVAAFVPPVETGVAAAPGTEPTTVAAEPAAGATMYPARSAGYARWVLLALAVCVVGAVATWRVAVGESEPDARPLATAEADTRPMGTNGAPDANMTAVAPDAGAARQPVAPTNRPKRGGVLRAGAVGEVAPYDLFYDFKTVSSVALDLAIEKLIEVSPEGAIEPSTIERWEVSEDGLTIDLHLRQGVLFHPHKCLNEGEPRPMTAADVVYSLKLTLDGPAEARVPGLRPVSKDAPPLVTAIEALSRHHVRLTLRAPAAYAMGSLSDVFLVPDGFDECEDLRDMKRPVGTGPFMFGPPGAGDVIEMKGFQQYWAKDAFGTQLPYVDAVELRASKQPSSVVGQLGEGRIHLVLHLFGKDARAVVDGLSEGHPALKPKLVGQPVKVVAGQAPRAIMPQLLLVMSKSGPLRESALVRRAIGLALDREALAQALPFPFDARGRFVPPGFLGYDPGAEVMRHDPEAAREALAAAGHAAGEGLPEIGLGAFRVLVPAAEVAGEQLRAVGLKVRVIDMTEMSAKGPLEKGTVDLLMTGYNDTVMGSEPYPYLGGLIRFYLARWSADAELARLMDALITEPGRDARGKLFAALEARLLETVAYVPLGFIDTTKPTHVFLTGPSVRGLVDPLTGRLRRRWSMAKVWLAR